MIYIEDDIKYVDINLSEDEINLMTLIYKDFINNYTFSIDSIDNIIFNYNKCIKSKNSLSLYFDIYHIEFIYTKTKNIEINVDELNNLDNILNDSNYIFKNFKIHNNQLILYFNHVNNKIINKPLPMSAAPKPASYGAADGEKFTDSTENEKKISSIFSSLFTFNAMWILIGFFKTTIISNHIPYNYNISDKINLTYCNYKSNNFITLLSSQANRLLPAQGTKKATKFTNTDFRLTPNLSQSTIQYIKSNLKLYKNAYKTNIKRGDVELTEEIIKEIQNIIPAFNSTKLNIRLILGDIPKHSDKILGSDEKSVDNYLFYLNKVKGQLIVGDETIEVEEGLGIKLSGEEHGFINSDPREIRYILGPFDINGIEVGITSSTIEKFAPPAKTPADPPADPPADQYFEIDRLIDENLYIVNEKLNKLFDTTIGAPISQLMGEGQKYSAWEKAYTTYQDYLIYYTNKTSEYVDNIIDIDLTDIDSIYLDSNIIFPIKVSSKKDTQSFLNKKVFKSYFLKVFIYIILVVTILLILYISNTIFKFI